MKTRKQKLSVLFASAAILGSTMAGCSGGTQAPKLTASNSQALAPQVERALGEKNGAAAQDLAERLVAAEPENAVARALLGRAYLANGRYVSARTAFTDAMTLGNRDSRTIVSLALVEAGSGNLDGARKLLGDHIADLPAGDYGLAMAMAGDPREGVRALLEASRLPDATARTRQNLAYALAMAGAWGQARLVAGQDLAANEAQARIGQWSQQVRTSESERVIAMLGVSPRGDDAGQPAQLALNLLQKQPRVALASAADIVGEALSNAPVSAEAQLATAATAEAPVAVPALAAVPVSEPKPAFAQDALMAAFASLPDVPAARVETASNDLAVKAAFASSPILTGTELARQAANAKWTPPAPVAAPAPKAAPKAAPMKVAASSAPVARKAGFLAAPATSPSDWVVQIGAFNNEDVATQKLMQIQKKYGVLKDYEALLSTLSLNSKTFHRLALRGFADRASAVSACNALRKVGQECFVRMDDAKQGPVASAQPAGRSRPAR